MTDRDNDVPNNDLGVNVFIKPMEVQVNADGTGQVNAFVAATGPNEEIIDLVLEDVRKDLGAREMGKPEIRKMHAFSSSRWNSPWNPKGPKPNWGKPPKDVREN